MATPTTPPTNEGAGPPGPAVTDHGAGLNPRELAAWRGLLRVHAALTKALDAELDDEHGIPLISYEVLMVLHDAPGRRMRMSDLADSVILSRSGLTRLVDRLERDGLLVRAACCDDARGSFAVLTEEGVARLAAARRTHLAGVRERFLSRFTPDELDVLALWWERVLPGAGDATAHAGEC